jgi:hypothetical protein
MTDVSVPTTIVEEQDSSVPFIPGMDGQTIPSHVISKRNYLYSTLTKTQQAMLHVDEVALYSVTPAKLAAEQAHIIRTFVGKDATITDATACTGGNTIAFGKLFRNVHAVEINRSRASMLRHNLDVVGIAEKVRVLEGDYTKLTLDLEQDVVFLDPPWGGPDYKFASSLNLYLGSTNVNDIIANLTFGRPSSETEHIPYARFIFLKAPLNFNGKELAETLHSCGSGATIVFEQEMQKMKLYGIASTHNPPLRPTT